MYNIKIEYGSMTTETERQTTQELERFINQVILDDLKYITAITIKKQGV